MTAIEKAAAKVVALAESEIGYREKATNSQLNDKTANAGAGNYTKYGAYFDGLRGEYEFYNGRKNGFDWCDQFVDYLFAVCYGIDTARKMLYQPMSSCGAGCAWSASYFRENGAFYSTPKVGDQIFFGKKGDESHTGIVAEINDSNVITIEGNANNMVMKRTYSKAYSNIAGYGRPDYALVKYQFEDQKQDEMKPVESPVEIQIRKIVDEMLTARFGKPIYTINDIPHESVRKVMRKLLDVEAVDGGTPYEQNRDDINLGAYDFVRVLVMAARYTDKTLPE